MKKIIKKGLKIILPLVLGVGIMVWLYKDMDFRSLWDTLTHRVNWWWMLAALVFEVLSHVLRGIRWRQLLSPLNERATTNNLVNAVFLSYAANLVLPRVGEVSRCAVLSKYDGVSFSKSLGTIVTERVIDTLLVLVMTVVAIGLNRQIFDYFFERTGTDLTHFADIFKSVYFYIFFFSGVGILFLAYYLMRTLSFFNKIKGMAKSIMEGILSIRNVRRPVLFTVATLGIWLCYFLQFYLTFFCFDFSANLSLMAGFVMFVAGSIAVIVPTPNGAGPWHFAVISIMVIYGVDKTDAGIFALIVHSIQTFLVVLLGIYAMIALQLTNKKQLKL